MNGRNGRDDGIRIGYGFECRHVRMGADRHAPGDEDDAVVVCDHLAPLDTADRLGNAAHVEIAHRVARLSAANPACYVVAGACERRPTCTHICIGLCAPVGGICFHG